jgi:acetate---CoA ligase (ADP-forming)
VSTRADASPPTPVPEKGPAALPSENLRRMLEARSVALVGASRTSGSLGDRALIELERSPGEPAVHLVNPRYAGEQIRGHGVVASLDQIPGPVDLVLLAVGDASLEAELARAARRGDRSAVIFGSAVGPTGAPSGGALRTGLASIATEAGMALCGGGCMGFISRRVRAIGYLERAPLAPGPIALVTHSGSAFSALLRTDRLLGWSLAVSSGQEIVTTTAEYLEYALALPETRVVAMVLETLRQPERFRAALAAASDADVAVVALTVGSSSAGRAMVAAHSGALAGSDASWEALFDAYGVLRVRDLHELCDTLELLVAGRRMPSRAVPHPTPAGVASEGGRGAGPGTGAGADPGRRLHGIAAVLDSGAERALVVDVAAECGVPFAELGPGTRETLAGLLDPGLEVANPLDVWGRGRSTEHLFAGALATLAADEAVDAVALAVDLVTEYDGDESYRDAIMSAWSRSAVPMCVLSNVPSALDRAAAGRLRESGIPVLEGTRSGLLALRHLQQRRDRADRPPALPPPVDCARRDRWTARLAAGPLNVTEGFRLLADYGVASPPSAQVSSMHDAVVAAERIGYPVAVKTAEAGFPHKSDVGGVVLGLRSSGEVAAAYEDLSTRLGPLAVVAAMAPEGVELSVGIVRDPLVGPVVVVGAGGTLVELLADRAVALPPLDQAGAARLLDRLAVRRLLSGYRGRRPADLAAAARAIEAVASVAAELAAAVVALDVNPLVCTPSGALALDVLVES